MVEGVFESYWLNFLQLECSTRKRAAFDTSISLMMFHVEHH